MKVKKALKRLNKIETLLSDVIGGLPKDLNGSGGILKSAKESVLEAKLELESKSSGSATKNAPSNAGASRVRHVTAAARRKISVGARRRGVAVKRNDMNPA